MHRLPIVCRNHFNRIPRTAIEKGSIGAFARALLTANAEIGIDFDATERRMIFVRHPEHAGFDGTVLNASGRAGAASAAVSRDGENARSLLALGFPITNRHRPFLFDDVESGLFLEGCHVAGEISIVERVAQLEIQIRARSVCCPLKRAAVMVVRLPSAKALG